MSTRILRKQFLALPPYLGGKRRLVSWIFQTLSQAIPKSAWHELTLIDAFVGGGAVSLYAKFQNFKQIQANDWSHRSQIIIQALLENTSIQLNREDILQLTQPLSRHELPGFIQQHFSPHVFALRHAQALDRILLRASQFQCPTKRALSQLLAWHLIKDFVCMATSIGTSNRPYAETLDGLRDWQNINPKRFMDGSFPNLLKPTWHTLDKRYQAINQGIWTGSPVQRSQMDASALVSQVQGDILYLDPPYPGCLSYEATNRTLDSILTRHLPDAQPATSPFTKDTAALEALLDQARHIPTWLLSYGNSQVSLDELKTLVKRHCPKRQVLAEARTFKHLPHVSQNKNNQELLILAHS